MKSVRLEDSIPVAKVHMKRWMLVLILANNISSASPMNPRRNP